MRRSLPFLVLAFLILACGGTTCGSCNNGPQPSTTASFCSPSDDAAVRSSDAGVPPGYTVTLLDDTGVAWTDGEMVTLYHGFQGGYMVAPRIQIVGTLDEPPAGGEPCFAVHIDNTFADGTVVNTYDSTLSASPVSGAAHTWQIDSVLDLLSFDQGSVNHHAITITATITGANGVGHQTIHVVPTSP